MTDFPRCRYCNARIARARHYDGWAHIERPDHFVSPHYAAPTSREAVVRRSPRRRPTASQAAGRSRAPRRAAAGGL